MIEVLEFNDRDGLSTYAEWFDRLSAQAAVKVAVAMTRLALGNFSNVKGVGSGVFECRIDFGPGLPRVFWKRRRKSGEFIGRWREERQQLDIQAACQLAGI
jgi:putative addiction module killer protein